MSGAHRASRVYDFTNNPLQVILLLPVGKVLVDLRQVRDITDVVADTVRVLKPASAVIAGGEYFTPEIIAGLPHLRVIARAGTGVDNVDVLAGCMAGVDEALRGLDDVRVEGSCEAFITSDDDDENIFLLALDQKRMHDIA